MRRQIFKKFAKLMTNVGEEIEKYFPGFRKMENLLT